MDAAKEYLHNRFGQDKGQELIERLAEITKLRGMATPRELGTLLRDQHMRASTRDYLACWATKKIQEVEARGQLDDEQLAFELIQLFDETLFGDLLLAS